jgi:hypothetical protein
MEPRLATSLVASALMRRAAAEGGFAAILAKGDERSGSMLVILAERGERRRYLERILQPDGQYGWTEVMAKAIGDDKEGDRQLERRRSFDPDLWVVELDVPDPERFAAEMNSST